MSALSNEWHNLWSPLVRLPHPYGSGSSTWTANENPLRTSLDQNRQGLKRLAESRLISKAELFCVHAEGGTHQLIRESVHGGEKRGAPLARTSERDGLSRSGGL